MPDNFAEPRDREVCGHPGEDGIDAQTRNLKLRVAQTLRTIAGFDAYQDPSHHACTLADVNGMRPEK